MSPHNHHPTEATAPPPPEEEAYPTEDRTANEPQGTDDQHEEPSAYRDPEMHSDNEPAGQRTAAPDTAVDAKANEPVDEITEEDMNRDFEAEVLDLAKDTSLSRKERSKKKKSLMARQAAVQKEKDRRTLLELEAKLPRPDWYTSDDDDEDSFHSDVEKEEVSELKTQPADGQGRIFVILYTVLSFVAFVFHLASSCPIPWMRGNGRKYGVWRATGGGMADLKVNNIHDCSNEMQYWQGAAALSVIATFTSCAAWICGVLLCVNKGHMGASFALSFYSIAFSLGSWALVVALYHYYRCGKGVFAKSGVHLDAGFALTLIAWVFHMAAFGILGIHFMKYWTRSVHSGKLHAVRIVYAAALVITLIFYCVGMAYNQWSKDFPLVHASVTMWHIEIYDKTTNLHTFLNRQTYKCTTITRRMKVVAAFMIMSITWLFFALVLATGAIYDSRLVKGSLTFGYACVIFALVGWLTLVATRYGNLCTGATPSGVSSWTDLGYNGIPSGINNAQINFKGYKMRAGFSLFVSGWAVSTVSVLLNTFLADY